MKYNYRVKYNGRIYAAGEEVPVTYQATDEDTRELVTTAPTFTEEQLNEMTIKEIIKKADEIGLEITASKKPEIIAEFMAYTKGRK